MADHTSSAPPDLPADHTSSAPPDLPADLDDPLPSTLLADLDEEVDRAADRAIAFLAALVAAESTLGNEAAAEDVLGEELARLGFEVSRLPIDPAVADDPRGGIPLLSYDGRTNLLARRGTGEGLLVNGHVDVVPVEAGPWSSPPFRPTVTNGWMVGRGAGDMKAGFAMVTLAVEALARAAPALAGERSLTVLGVIEEECTGNGTLSTLRQGIVADTVLLPEPTDLGLLLAGVGVLWVDVELSGRGGHASDASQLATPLAALPRLLQALEELASHLAADHPDPALDGVDSPYNVNVGTVRAGAWRSSVATEAALGVRVGFPRGWTPEQALEAVEEALAGAKIGAGDGLSLSVRPSGFRAEGYALAADDPLALALAGAHRSAHGAEPRRFGLGSTTDARLYLTEPGVSALCYGPVVRDIHGVDEAVELSSIVRGAKTLARLLAAGVGQPGWREQPGWWARVDDGGEPGGERRGAS